MFITFSRNEFIHFVNVFFCMCNRSSCNVFIRSFSNFCTPSRVVIFERNCICDEYPPGSYCGPIKTQKKNNNKHMKIGIITNKKMLQVATVCYSLFIGSGRFVNILETKNSNDRYSGNHQEINAQIPMRLQ